MTFAFFDVVSQVAVTTYEGFSTEDPFCGKKTFKLIFAEEDIIGPTLLTLTGADENLEINAFEPTLSL